MNFRSVDLNLLTVFDAIMVECNITRAADKIGMSQSAMSQALSRLRHLTGDQLFERQARGLKPTPRALELVQPVRQALDILATALEPSTSFDCTSNEKEFNLALSDYGEIVLLPRLMSWLSSLNAKARITIHPIAQQDFKKELHFGNLDLFLWTIPIKDPEIHCEQITTITQSCVVRENHPLIRESITLEQYTEIPHIVFKWPEHQGPMIVDKQLQAVNLERNTALQVHSYLDAPRVLAVTDMICTMPTPIAQTLAKEHKLKVIPLPVEKFELPLYIMWHTSMMQNPAHIWLRNFIIGLCKRV